MSGKDDEGARSGFTAFWTSLPGVLTGIAAVIAAAGTLAALFGGDGDSTSPPAEVAVRSGPTAAPGSRGGDCLSEYFERMPPDRVDPVEAGAQDFDAIAADQPKAGTIGLKLTNNNSPIGAIRLAYYPANEIFKIESVVDKRCAQIEDYANVARGGDKNVLQNWDTVRLRLGGEFYDLRIGASTTIRLNFERYVP